VSEKATQKESYLLVRLVVGPVADPDAEYKFTNWTSDVGAYVTVPSMAVSGMGNSGTLDEKEIQLEFNRDSDPFLDEVSSGMPHAPITLFLAEVWNGIGPSTGTRTQIHALGDYRCERATRNPDRRFGLVRLKFASWKKRMAIQLGIACTPSCQWTLGDKSCAATVNEEATVITAINRKRVTTNQASVVEGRTAKLWFPGVMKLGGLSIGIRDWENESYDFELRQEPPASWLGQNVIVRPGCEKTLTACQVKFANLTRFGGSGLKVPSYHTVLEAP
jgi:hypothetical protein